MWTRDPENRTSEAEFENNAITDTFFDMKLEADFEIGKMKNIGWGGE